MYDIIITAFIQNLHVHSFLHVFATLCKTKFIDTFINFMTNAQCFAVVAKNFTLVTHRSGREEM